MAASMRRYILRSVRPSRFAAVAQAAPRFRLPADLSIDDVWRELPPILPQRVHAALQLVRRVHSEIPVPYLAEVAHRLDDLISPCIVVKTQSLAQTRRNAEKPLHGRRIGLLAEG